MKTGPLSWPGVRLNYLRPIALLPSKEYPTTSGSAAPQVVAAFINLPVHRNSQSLP
jgi:hypothetical protein